MSRVYVEPGILNRIAAKFGLGTSEDDEDSPRYHLKFWLARPDGESGIYLLHYVKKQITVIMSGIDAGGAALFTEAQRNALLSLRGVVYDVAADRIICDSDGRLPHITCTDWPNMENPYDVPATTDHITDEFGRQHAWLVQPGVKFRTGFDGVLFRFYKVDGRIRVAISQNPDILTTPNSRWGNNKLSFMELWYSLGGPNPETFFTSNPSFATSKFQHHFVIVDNSLNTGTRFNDSFILFVETRELTGSFLPGETSPLVAAMTPTRVAAPVVSSYGEDPADAARRLLSAPPTTITFGSKGALDISTYRPLPPINPAAPIRSGVYSVPQINYLRVRQILLSGYFSYDGVDMSIFPPEMRPSGFVIAEGPQGQRAKIASPGYNWRQAVNGPLPNLKARAYSFFDLSLKYEPNPEDEAFQFRGIDRDTYRFGQLFKLSWADALKVPSEDALQEKKRLIEINPANISYHPIEWLTGEGADKLRLTTSEGREARLRHAVGLFAFAAPISKQAEVLGYYSNFLEDRRLVSEFLNTHWAVLVATLGEARDDLHAVKPFSDFPITEKIKNAAGVEIGRKLSKAGTDMKRLFETAWRSADRNLTGGPDVSARARTNLANLLGKERGSSIHRMSHAIRRAAGVEQDEPAEVVYDDVEA